MDSRSEEKNTAEVTEHDHQEPSKSLQKSLLEVVKTRAILDKMSVTNVLETGWVL